MHGVCVFLCEVLSAGPGCRGQCCAVRCAIGGRYILCENSREVINKVAHALNQRADAMEEA